MISDGRFFPFIKSLRDFIQYVYTDLDLLEDGIQKTPLQTSQLNNRVWFLMFILLNVGEQLEKESKMDAKILANLACRNLIDIRMGLSHKQFLIAPSDYTNFMTCLHKDLLPSDSEVTFAACRSFVNNQVKRILRKQTLLYLFVYWSTLFQVSYQSALRDAVFVPDLEDLTFPLMDSLRLNSESFTHHTIPCFSLIIVLGQLSLKVSQHLYPRDIQKPRASRETMVPLEQLLFDLQQIRNELVHQALNTPLIMANYKGFLVGINYYLLDILRSLKIEQPQFDAVSSLASTGCSYRFLCRKDKGENIPNQPIEGTPHKPKKKKRGSLFTIELYQSGEPKFSYDTERGSLSDKEFSSSLS